MRLTGNECAGFKRGEHKEHKEEGEGAKQIRTKRQKEHKVQLFGHRKQEDHKGGVNGERLISGGFFSTRLVHE